MGRKSIVFLWLFNINNNFSFWVIILAVFVVFFQKNYACVICKDEMVSGHHGFILMDGWVNCHLDGQHLMQISD